MNFVCFKVLRLRGEIPREQKWDTVVDLFFYREPEEAEKEEQAAKELPAPKPEPVIEPQETDWTASANADNWAEETTPAAAVVPPAAAAPAGGAAAPAAAPAYNTSDDWATLVQEDWAANATAQQPAQHSWNTNTTDWS